ncbi:carbohydrate kinase family protein [Ferroplasma sp.]|uniref:carbohydrate kinase family protein n=1 Tax=Ferroplasma sp. TaxID=2591003 RepID=UPI00307D8894
MKFLAFFGHLNIDVSISVQSLPAPGQATGVKQLKEKFAGTAGNFTYVAHSLGLDFDLYSIVGNLSHKRYIQNLEETGINTEHVEIAENESGPVCYIPSDGKEQVAYMFQGPVNNWKASKNFEFGNYNYVNIGTGPVNEYIKIVSIEKRERIVFDPAQEIWYNYNSETAEYMVNHCNMIIMNRKEYAHLLELLNISSNVLASKVSNIVITEGKKGATVIQHEVETNVPGILSNNVIDTVGAGDSFRAGLYTGLWKGYNLVDAVRIGNITASKAIENNINEFNLKFDDILKILNSIKG